METSLISISTLIEKYDFFRYGIVGITTVVLDFILLFIFFSYLRISESISITLAYGLASIYNFYLHKYFTFKSENNPLPEIIKFILIVFSSYLITLFSVNYMVDNHINIYIAKIISLFCVYGYVYLISKFFIFRSKN